MTTRAYNISELGLMRLEDVLKAIVSSTCYFDGMGEKMFDISYDGTLDIPIKSYAASVVERFAKTLPEVARIMWNNIEYDEESNEIIFSPYVKVFHCPINPFTGLLNPDGTQRTSSTREEIEQWRNEV